MAEDTFALAVAVQALAARQRVLSIALRHALAVLAVSQADRVRARIIETIETDAAGPVMAIPEVDEATADELSGILSALGSVARGS
jgi:hypothetical protein